MSVTSPRVARAPRLVLLALGLWSWAPGCTSSNPRGTSAHDGRGSAHHAGDGDTPGACDLGPHQGKDRVLPSQSPPCGLSPSQVPMFVSIGFDDNDSAEGMTWALDMLEARKARATFFNTSSYGDDAAVLATWKRAREAGHELGNHTRTHLPDHGGRTMSAEAWRPEIEACSQFLLEKGVVSPRDLSGFRAPYLEYGEGTLAAVQALGFRYDASIEEGYEEGQNGKNFYWPYTLDTLSPGHTVQVGWDASDELVEIGAHPGLWELPVYTVFVPEDMRAEMKKRQSWFDPAGGQITGFDYNMWVGASPELGGFQMNKEEMVRVLKHTFDLRCEGNRAPFLFGGHTGLYVDSQTNDDSVLGHTKAAERRAAIEEFLDYVLSKKDVRVVPYDEVLRWLRNPKPL